MSIHKHEINSENAPKPGGPYAQAIKVGHTIYLSGQVGQDPKSMELVSKEMHDQIRKIFENLSSISKSAGGDLNSIVKLTIYVTDLECLPILNNIIMTCFAPPFPARSVIQVAGLPKAAKIEIEAIMVI